jgi:1-acyl-sn-glycerol-3-phosphate acyltransferase
MSGLAEQFRQVRRGRDWRGRAWTAPAADPGRSRSTPAQFPTAWARSPVPAALRLGFQRALLRPATWTFTRPEVHGLDHLAGAPTPMVLVANHASHLDAALILGSLPVKIARRTAVAAAADYFFDVPWRGALTALTMNGFPVGRKDGASGTGGAASTVLARHLLQEGWNLLIFPEGTRSEDGWMGTTRRGAAHLCCALDVPAVPVAVHGTFAAMPKGRSWPVPGRRTVGVRYGRPLRPGTGERAAQIHQRLRVELARLWNEEDLGWYKARRAEPGQALERAAGPDAARWRRIWAAQATPQPLPGRNGLRRGDGW